MKPIFAISGFGLVSLLTVGALLVPTVSADDQPSSKPATPVATQVVKAHEVTPAKQVGVDQTVTNHEQTKHYTIQWGDTLSQLSVDNQVNMQILANRNRISDPNLIYANADLAIPQVVGTPVRVYVVQPNDTLDSIADKTGIAKDDIQLRSHLLVDTVTPGQILTLDVD